MKSEGIAVERIARLLNTRKPIGLGENRIAELKAELARVRTSVGKPARWIPIKVKGMPIPIKAYAASPEESKRFGTLMDKLTEELKQRDFKDALIKLGLVSESNKRLKLTRQGKQFMEFKADDPLAARLKKMIH